MASFPCQKAIIFFLILLQAALFTTTAIAGKTVYFVDEFALASGTIYDILRLIPLVQVADDGTISIRGNTSTQVMIDGRPAAPGGDYQSILQQLDIEVVKLVEVNTLASARYDAEASGGIVNIVLTGEQIEGTSGSASASAATGEKYNFNGSVGTRKGKWNGRLNLSGQQYNSRVVNSVYTESYYPDETVYTHQRIVNKPEIQRINANGSLDYHIDDANTIQLMAVLGTREINIDTEIESLSSDEDANYAYTNRREDNGTSSRLDLNYDGRLSTPNDSVEKLSANASWYFSQTEDFRQQQLIYDDVTDSDLTRGNLQVDFEKEMPEGGRIEAGARSYLRNTVMDYNRDLIEEDGTVTPIQTDNFKFNENVHAIYTQWNGRKGGYNLNLGVRSELSFTKGTQTLVDESFKKQYLYLFPSAQISHAIDRGYKISFNYSRTIRRPAIYEMNPFVNDMNPNNIQYGNPELKPALTDHFELKYDGQYQRPQASDTDEKSRTHKWYIALLYKNRKDQIYRASLPSSESEGVIENSYYNMKFGFDAGLEIFYSIDLLEGWRLDVVPRYTYLYRNGTNIDPDIKSTADQWQVRASANIDLWKDARLTINTIYIAGYNSPQGSQDGLGWTNFRLQQFFWDNKLTLGAALKDPFGQSKVNSHTRQPEFLQDRTIDPEGTIFELTLQYDFGQFKMTPANVPDDVDVIEGM